MSLEDIRQVSDELSEPVSIETMTPRELLDYCESLDENSEHYIVAITQALAVGMQLFTSTSKQIKSGNFPNFSMWNIASNYYSTIEQIQDMIQAYVSRIQSEV